MGIGKPMNIMEKSQSGGLLMHPNTSSETMKIDKADAAAVIMRRPIPIRKPIALLLVSVDSFCSKS